MGSARIEAKTSVINIFNYFFESTCKWLGGTKLIVKKISEPPLSNAVDRIVQSLGRYVSERNNHSHIFYGQIIYLSNDLHG